MSGFTRDFKQAWRLFFRTPGFTTVVVLTLALGIGTTTAIFSFVSGVLLAPLPYEDPQGLVNLCESHPARSQDWCGASPTNWQDWRRQTQTLEELGLARSWAFSVKLGGAVQGVRGGIATPGLFQTFKVRPQSGRLFTDIDVTPGNEHVAIVSHQFRVSNFGLDAPLIGQSIEIDGVKHEIVGTLPDGFSVPDLAGVELWIPLWPERLAFRSWRGFRGFGRLKPETSLEAVRAEMSAIRGRLAEQFPEDNADWGIVVDSLHERTVRPVKAALMAFSVAVILVLLIACANTAHLLLARGATRERELVVRLALGVRRSQLLRLLLLESLPYALAGGLGGILLAFWSVDLFVAAAPTWFPRIQNVELDWEVLGFCLVTACLTPLLFGLAPILQALKLNVNSAFRGGQRALGVDRRRGRSYALLVSGEIAMACLLVVGAGLLTKSYANLLDWDSGFEHGDLAVTPLFVSPGKYTTGEEVSALFHRAVEELGAVPGVISAAGGSAVPLFGGDGEQEFSILGRPDPPGQKPVVAWFDTTPGYFQTLGIPLLEGRWFTDADRQDAPDVAVVNESMAKRFWPGESPLGQRVEMALSEKAVEIVGVVGDVQPFRPDQPPQPQLYWPFAQAPRWAVMLIARTELETGDFRAALETRMEELEPDLDISRTRTMDELVSDRLINPAFNAGLADLFGGIALLIALIGVYGVMSLSVQQRFPEFGVRIALGARNWDLRREVLGNALLLAGVGVTAGLLASWLLTHLLTNLLIDVTPTDPSTYAVIALVLMMAAGLASYFPARRATRVDPLEVIRSQ